MLENTQAAMDDLADLGGTLVGTLESGKGMISEIESLVTDANIRSDVAGLMTSVPAAATEIAALAKGGVFTIIADAPAFIADATAAYAKLIAAIAAAKGVAVVVTTAAAAPATATAAAASVTTAAAVAKAS